MWIIYVVLLGTILQQEQVDTSSLLEARQHELWSYQLDEDSRDGFLADSIPECILRNITHASALAIDVRRKYLFYSDVQEKVTYRVNFQSTPLTESILYGWGSVQDIAVDWITQNIFWTDSTLQHVAVSRYDGSHRHILIYEEIGEPRGIAVHPTKGYIFWSDISSTSRIERTDMTGHNRLILINYSLLSPNGLTIDYSLERLYFVDGGTYNIEYVDFNGLGRTLILHRNRADFFDVSLIGNFLFTTSQSGGISTVTNQQDSDFYNFIPKTKSHLGDSLGLAANDELTQPGISASCGIHNGDCEQLCLPISTSTFRCACSTGYALDSNQRTCKSVLLQEPFILVVDSSLGKIIQIDGSKSYSSYSALPVENIFNPIGVAYDPIESKVYWTDSVLEILSRSNLNGSEEEVIATDNIEGPSGITIDPVRRLLFWTDEVNNVIEKISLNGSGRGVYVTSGLYKPRGIAVNSLNGDLYWSTRGSQPKIERISEQRKNRVVIVDTDINRPNGITLDVNNNLLYWCDSQTNGRIEVSDLNGDNRRILAILASSSHPFGLAIQDNLLFYTDWNMNALLAVNRFEESPRAIHFGPKIFMRMHGITSSYYANGDSWGGSIVDPSNIRSSHGDTATLELPIFIIAGGGAFLLVSISFTIVLILYRNRLKVKNRLRLQRPSIPPNRPIPPTPSQSGAMASFIAVKTVDLPDETTPDPYTGEHLYMDLDQLTARHLNEPPLPFNQLTAINDSPLTLGQLTASHINNSPPPCSSNTSQKDLVYFKKPTLSQKDDDLEVTYYHDRHMMEQPHSRPNSIQDTYYIDPISEDNSNYQFSIPSIPLSSHDPSVDYTNELVFRLDRHSIASEYIKLKTQPKDDGDNDNAKNYACSSEYFDFNITDDSNSTDNSTNNTSDSTVSEEQYMDPLSTQESLRVRRENQRMSQIEERLRRNRFQNTNS